MRSGRSPCGTSASRRWSGPARDCVARWVKPGCFKLDAASAILSAVSLSADGALLLRLYEAAGKRDAVSVTLPLPVSSAEFISLDEQASAGTIAVQGKRINFELSPYTIRTVKLRF